MTVIVAPLHGGLLALLFVALSLRVIGGRRRMQVGLGDGGDRRLLRRIRAHANFAEYVPLGLVLLVLAELQQAPAAALHGIGLLLVTGRLAHAWGVGREPETAGLRVLGTGLTFTALGGAALGQSGDGGGAGGRLRGRRGARQR